jgi:ABC-type multidrug transport system permease subunit
MFFSRFEEEVFTTGEVRDSCIPVSSQPEDQSVTYSIIGVTVAVTFLAVIAYFCYKSYRKQGNMHCFLGGYLTIISFM